MANKTINQALKDLFLGLGGNESALSDNQTVSDYIDDLESAIKASASGAAEDLIDDETASETTTYSSSKIASLIPENELPTPAVGDIGKVVSVVSDGESGAEYALETPSGGGGEYLKASYNAQNSTWTFPDGYDRSSFIQAVQSQPSIVTVQLFNITLQIFSKTNLSMSSFTDEWIFYQGIAVAGTKLYEVIFKVNLLGLLSDEFYYREFPTT